MDIRRANTIEIVNLPVRDGIGHEANVAGDSRPAGAYVRRSRYVAGGSALLILRINGLVLRTPTPALLLLDVRSLRRPLSMGPSRWPIY
jgi:hypothetical protein